MARRSKQSTRWDRSRHLWSPRRHASFSGCCRSEAVCVLALILILPACQSLRLATAPFPSALAQVNGSVITMRQRDEEIDRIFPGVRPSQLSAARAQALEACILRALLEQRAHSLKLSHTQADMDGTIDQINSLVRGPSSPLPRTMLLSSLAGPFSEPSARKVRAYYKKNMHRFVLPENVRARHILVTVGPGTGRSIAEGRASIERLRAQLLGGASFSELARKHSNCESAQSGGNLGTICRDSALPEPIIKAAFSQAKSAVGPPIRSRAGYHVIQVLQHNKRGVLPFEHVKNTLATHLKEEQAREQISRFVAQLRREASIVRFVPQ